MGWGHHHLAQIRAKSVAVVSVRDRSRNRELIPTPHLVPFGAFNYLCTVGDDAYNQLIEITHPVDKHRGICRSMDLRRPFAT